MKTSRLVRLGLLLTFIVIGALAIALFQARSLPKAAAQDSEVHFTHSIHIPVAKSDSPDVDEALFAPALAAVAAQHGVAVENLSILNVVRSNYPVSGNTAYAFKVVDAVTGETYGVSVDAAGAAVDSAQLDAAEAAAYTARYGVYEPELADMIAAGTVPASLPVVIWLKEPEYVGPDRPSPDERATLSEAEIDAFYAVVDAQRSAHVAQVTAPVAARLAGMGLPAQTDAYAPVVYTTLDTTALRSVSAWGEIDTIYTGRDDNEPEMGTAGPTINANIVWGRGITGSGVRVGVIEVGGRAATANPYMSFTQDTTSACTTASSHSTGVAGIIRSTFSSGRGIGYGATMRVGGSCGGVGSQLQSRSTAAADWGARAINLSWGSDTGRVPGDNDRFYDNMVITRFRTVVKSAGNLGSGCSGNGNITSPGLAYNIITVGNFNDAGSVSWTGDSMSGCSSWRDPISTNGDREKPEVAAPGSNITALSTASPWNNYTNSGTSFAAPMVTGMAALLMQRSTALTTWPEAVKAIAMVSAVHNIEGSARLSEYDGAGAIVADRADDIARGVNGTWGARSYTCTTGATLNATTMYLYAGTRTRVAITWDTPTSYSQYASRPSADLDLRVVNASGSTVASSSSFDNTYEIVDFTPSATGTYTLRVIRYRCDASPAYLGWAWKRGS